MNSPLIVSAFPNEEWQLIIEFNNQEHRCFKLQILWEEKGWHQLAFPQHYKNYLVSPVSITWPLGGKAGLDLLYERSTPIDAIELQFQSLRLGMKNQAPTDKDKNHHVYYVNLAPLSVKPFLLGESVTGGFADRGYSSSHTLPDLLAKPSWVNHFQFSGCNWAVELIRANPVLSQDLTQALISGACQRNGMEQSKDQASRSKISQVWQRFF